MACRAFELAADSREVGRDEHVRRGRRDRCDSCRRSCSSTRRIALRRIVSHLMRSRCGGVWSYSRRPGSLRYTRSVIIRGHCCTGSSTYRQTWWADMLETKDGICCAGGSSLECCGLCSSKSQSLSCRAGSDAGGAAVPPLSAESAREDTTTNDGHLKACEHRRAIIIGTCDVAAGHDQQNLIDFRPLFTFASLSSSPLHHQHRCDSGVGNATLSRKLSKHRRARRPGPSHPQATPAPTMVGKKSGRALLREEGTTGLTPVVATRLHRQQTNA